MKKKLLTLALVAILAAIFATGTLAFYTSEAEAHNVITTGGVDIAIEEWQETEAGLVPYPDEDIDVMPGVAVSKIATVRNHQAESWIRARFEVTILDADKQPMELSPETLASIITIATNGDHWLRKEGDGIWWYYADPVATGEATEAFFTDVVFDGPNMTNEYQGCTVLIDVYAQAVQTANNGESALEASGWGAE